MSEEMDLPRPTKKTDRVFTNLAEYREQRPGPPHGTHWRNDGTEPMRARLFVGPRDGLDPRARRELLTWTGWYAVALDPGAVVELPSEWDTAIQTVKGGRVVAGLMPRAQRVADPASGLPDPEPLPLHPSLEERAAPARRRRKAGA